MAHSQVIHWFHVHSSPSGGCSVSWFRVSSASCWNCCEGKNRSTSRMIGTCVLSLWVRALSSPSSATLTGWLTREKKRYMFVSGLYPACGVPAVTAVGLGSGARGRGVGVTISASFRVSRDTGAAVGTTTGVGSSVPPVPPQAAANAITAPHAAATAHFRK